jgi:hypothetical protein
MSYSPLVFALVFKFLSVYHTEWKPNKNRNKIIFKDTNIKPVHRAKNTKYSLKQNTAPNKTKNETNISNKKLQFTHQLPSATQLRKPHNPKSCIFIHQNAVMMGQGTNIPLP